MRFKSAREGFQQSHDRTTKIAMSESRSSLIVIDGNPVTVHQECKLKVEQQYWLRWTACVKTFRQEPECPHSASQFLRIFALPKRQLAGKL
jgi:hypothetical protein